MPRAPKDETYEEKKQRYLKAGYNSAKGRKQNRNPDGSLRVTEDDLWSQAYAYMEKAMAREAEAGRLKAQIHERFTEDDEKYREQQVKKYTKDYEWNNSNDLAQLDHILSLEVQIRRINRELEFEHMTPTQIKELRRSLTEAVGAHRQAIKDLGIDRPTREKKSSTDNPIDDWERIKEEALLKKQQQKQKLLDALPELNTEAELRDYLKYGLVEKFDIIDPILMTHRRVLGLPEQVTKS